MVETSGIAGATTPEGRVAPAPTHRGDRWLEAAINLMRSRPSQPHTVASLAKYVGMSRSNFAEAFRLGYGRTPMEFLRTTRLDHAANLLSGSSLAIKLVGASAGYHSRTSFALAFRRAFGMSPAGYRASRATRSPIDIHAVSARLRALQGVSQDLAWEVDLVSGAVWWSEGTFAALGYDTPRQLVSDVARFYERVHPADRAAVVESAGAACSDGRMIWEAEFRFRKADGSFARIANGCVILRNRDGAASRLIGVMRVNDEADGPAG